jgi:ankyrin repeat protein
LTLADVDSQQLVHKAIWTHDMEMLRAFMKHPSLRNIRDHRGLTPLALAHRLGYEDVVNTLLEMGADPRIKNPKGLFHLISFFDVF